MIYTDRAHGENRVLLESWVLLSWVLLGLLFLLLFYSRSVDSTLYGDSKLTNIGRDNLNNFLLATVIVSVIVRT